MNSGIIGIDPEPIPRLHFIIILKKEKKNDTPV
jgi:hypothetical protein